MRTFRVGDPVIFPRTLDDPFLTEGTVTRSTTQQGTAVIWVDNKHLPEDCLYASFAWPAQYKKELREILEKRAALKKAYDDSMGLVYELRNRITREQTGGA